MLWGPGGLQGRGEEKMFGIERDCKVGWAVWLVDGRCCILEREGGKEGGRERERVCV
jgi:hypothetical protein